MLNFDFLKNKPIAHRGMFNKNEGIPENSMPSFEKAINEGYIIELDIHLLKDGKIVVFHDDDLERMTGVKKKIKDCTYNEIKEFKLNGTNYTIPLFLDVLNLVNGKVPILIELKYDRKNGELERELAKILTDYKGDYAVQSFNPCSVNWFKRNLPEVPRGQLSSNYKKSKMFIIKKLEGGKV